MGTGLLRRGLPGFWSGGGARAGLGLDAWESQIAAWIFLDGFSEPPRGALVMTELVGGITASDHYAVLAEIRM
jgi:hypothetical protein